MGGGIRDEVCSPDIAESVVSSHFYEFFVPPSRAREDALDQVSASSPVPSLPLFPLYSATRLFSSGSVTDVFSSPSCIPSHIQFLPHDLESRDLWKAYLEAWGNEVQRPYHGIGPGGPKKYKKVDKKVRPVPGIIWDEDKTIRRIPEDPLLTLPALTMRPPTFEYSEKLTKERVDKMAIDEEEFLLPEERKLLLHVLRINESAIAYTEKERGNFSKEYFSDYIIPVLTHVPWNDRPLPMPPGLEDQLIAYLKAKVEAGLYEPAISSYSSRWFCVLKKGGKLRIVHDLQKLNSITIRDGGRPPEPDEFISRCAGSSIYTVFDLFSGYDARIVHPKSRDLCAFNTPIGMFRPTGLPQGFTNAVQEFQACMTFILKPEMPHIAAPFIDDIPVCGPKTRYETPDGYETIPGNTGIRRFVWEHANDVNRVLHRIKCSGATVSGHKIQLGLKNPLIVGQVCAYEGRLPDPRKITAVQKWPVPEDLTQVRSFLGLCGGVRIWIKGYSELARPLTELMRKDEPFEWTERRQKAFEELKDKVTSAPALRAIDYKSDNEVILSVDTSHIAVGFYLAQIDDDGKKRIARYGSLPMNEREARYSQPKLELYGLFRALRQFRIFVIGVKNLTIEVDAKYIKGMINAPDVMPSASMNRWIAGILLFQFNLRHVPGKTHRISDGLSRRPPAEDDEVREDEGWLDEQLGYMVTRALNEPSQQLVECFVARMTGSGTRNFVAEEQRIGEIKEYLETMIIPEWAQDEKTVTKFIRQAAAFYLQKGSVYQRQKKGGERKVVQGKEDRDKILKAGHDDLGHRGVFATRKAITSRFWWPSVYNDIKNYVANCHTCQIRSTAQTRIPLTVSEPSALFQKIYVDVMFMPVASGFKAIVAARDDLSGLAEGRALRKVTSAKVADFLLEQVIYRYGCPSLIVTDNGSEARGWTEKLLQRYSIPQAKISAYNSRANGVVEHGHFIIREAIIRYCEGKVNKWPQLVDLAFFADRITTRKQTGLSPYRLAYGVDPVLPIDLTEWTYQAERFKDGMRSDDLLAARMRLLERRQEDIDAAATAVVNSRWGSKERYEKEHARRLQTWEFQKGSLVLVRNVVITNTVSLQKKTEPRYLGPFVVERQTRGGSYVLKELDGTIARKGIAAFRLVPYKARPGYDLPHEPLKRLGLGEGDKEQEEEEEEQMSESDN